MPPPVVEPVLVPDRLMSGAANVGVARNADVMRIPMTTKANLVRLFVFVQIGRAHV